MSVLPAAAAGAGRIGGPELPVALGAVVVFGCGTVAAGAGWASGEMWLLAAGGGLVALGLGLLLIADWVAGLPILAFTLVLPAPVATDQYRLSAAAAVTAVVVLAWCLRRGVDGGALRLDALPRRSLAAFVGALLLSTAFAQALLPAARELVTLLLLAGLLVAALDELAGEEAAVARLARLLAWVAGAAGVAAALEAAAVLPGRFPLPGTSLQRATLGFGWPNELGMFFALTLPLAVFTVRAASRPAARWLGAAALAGVALGLAASFSRGSWLAVPVGALALLLAGEGRLVLRVWAAGAAAAVLLDLASGGAVIGRLETLPTDWVVEQRAALVLTALLMVRESPLVGLGPGGFAEHLERFGPQVSWLWDYVGSAHNSYVHLAAETGMLGAAAFVALVATIFVALARSARASRRAREWGGAFTRQASGDALLSREAHELRLALLWAFGIVVALGMLEWVLAHGVGQLVVLVAAMGLALVPRAGAAGPRDPSARPHGHGPRELRSPLP